MKTIEEKAKAYDKATAKAIELFNSPRTCFDIDQLTEMFPELNESEDERIRKWLIKTINLIGVDKDICADQETIDKAIAWLEKQKKPENASASTMIPSCWEVEQKEPKPAWSEEDEKNMATLFEILNCYQRLYDGGVIVSVVDRREFLARMTELSNWLKSHRPSWKPSEEQMKALDKAIPVCMGVAGEDEISPLISLYEQLKKL